MGRVRIKRFQKWISSDDSIVTVSDIYRGIVYFRKDESFKTVDSLPIDSFVEKYTFKPATG